jgi:uncharacterized protein YuzE
MRITYDYEAQAAYIYVNEGMTIISTETMDSRGDINVDRSMSGVVVGIEILGVNKIPTIEDITKRIT